MSDLAIEATGLVKRYRGQADGDVPALDGVDLAVRRGGVCALHGPNGAGKTTAVRILTTLLRPDGGQARVAGADVRREPHEVRRRIGVSGQEPAVDEILGGRQNLVMFARLLGLPKAAAHGRADALLEQFGPARAADRPVRQYSGGMRRRLDVAVTLLLAPQVLFLDEPTTASTPAAGPRCGRRSGPSSPAGRRCSSRRSTSTRSTGWPTRSSSRRRPGHRRRVADRAQGPCRRRPARGRRP